MDYTKLWTLVELLERETKARRLVWETTAAPNSFQVAFQNYSLVIREDHDPERETDWHTILVCDKAGRIIESATDDDFVGDSFFSTERNARVRMRELYNNARRCAFGVERALDEIMGELKKQAK
jgi:hypothetical protein